MPRKPLTDSEQLVKLHLVLSNHLGDLKHLTDQLRRNQVKRGIRTLDNTTSYLAKALLSIAQRQGMRDATVRRLARQAKVKVPA